METPKTTPGSSPTHSDRHGQENILVADQDARVVELLQITLSGRGYVVRMASDGEAALEEIERQRPDLAVLGVRLPRKSGFQIVELLRANPRTARLPIILIASTPSNESRIQGLRLGADDYLVKPFSPRELMIKIRTILDRTADLKLLQARQEALIDEARRQREELHHAREEMGRYLARIGGVLHHVQEVGRPQDLESLLKGLIDACGQELGLARVCVFVHGKGASDLRPRAWSGIEELTVRLLRLPREGFLCQSLQLEARTMAADEFAGYPLANDDVLKLSAAGLTHMTPILSDERELVAIVAGGEKATGEPIDRFDLHLLDVLAHSAAGAIRDTEASAATRRSFVDTAAQLIAVVEGRYPHLHGHSARVRDLAARIAEELGQSQGQRETIAYVASLHDLGGLDDYAHLQEETRALTDEERVALRRRGSEGVRRLLEDTQMSDVARGLYHLSEHWNGRGVPEGLGGETIPLASRVVAIANAYDALTHARPHRPAYEAGQALAILREQAGQQYDPALVAAFERAIVESEGAGQSLSIPTMRGPESRSK
jgi:response regulator RpfG family c-di-GMP phosphodiesterase